MKHGLKPEDIIPGKIYRIRQWEDMVAEFGLDPTGDITGPNHMFHDTMRRLCGRKYVPSEIDKDGWCSNELDGYFIAPWMLEEIPTEEEEKRKKVMCPHGMKSHEHCPECSPIEQNQKAPQPFADAKVGDRVWSARFGRAVISQRNPDTLYIETDYGITFRFGLAGVGQGCSDTLRTLYWDVPHIIERPKPVAPEPVEVVRWECPKCGGIDKDITYRDHCCGVPACDLIKLIGTHIPAPPKVRDVVKEVRVFTQPGGDHIVRFQGQSEVPCARSSYSATLIIRGVPVGEEV
jgi:hypothetical protein